MKRPCLLTMSALAVGSPSARALAVGSSIPSLPRRGTLPPSLSDEPWQWAPPFLFSPGLLLCPMSPGGRLRSFLARRGARLGGASRRRPNPRPGYFQLPPSVLLVFEFLPPIPGSYPGCPSDFDFLPRMPSSVLGILTDFEFVPVRFPISAVFRGVFK